MNKAKFIYLFGILALLVLMIFDSFELFIQFPNPYSLLPFYILGGIFLLNLIYWLILKRSILQIEKIDLKKHFNLIILLSSISIILTFGMEWLEQKARRNTPISSQGIFGEFEFSNYPVEILSILVLVVLFVYAFYIFKIGHRLHQQKEPQLANLNEFGLALKILIPLGLVLGFIAAFFGFKSLDYLGLVLIQIPNFILLSIYWDIFRNTNEFFVKTEIAPIVRKDPDSEFPNAD